jgi:hypothetical protein
MLDSQLVGLERRSAESHRANAPPRLSDRRQMLQGSAAAVVALVGGSARAESPRRTQAAITPAQFERWLALRGGLQRPAYWYSEGLVRPIGDDGRVSARMLGLETWITPAALRSPTRAVSLSRKIFFHLEPDRDAIVIDRATGRPARPSIFAFQLRTFSLQQGGLHYDVESHNLTAITRGGANSVYTFTEVGEQLHVNYSTYPLRAQPDGAVRSTSGEIYDYVDTGPRASSTPERYQMYWVGANLEGRVQNMHGWRFDAFEQIPNVWLQRTVRELAPEWMAPPATLADIETLRGRLPYRVPGLGL